MMRMLFAFSMLVIASPLAAQTSGPAVTSSKMEDLETILGTNMFEPAARQVVKLTIEKQYNDNLNQSGIDEFEKLLPGIRYAMFDAAYQAAIDSNEKQIALARDEARQELATSLTPQQLARLRFLFAPFYAEVSKTQIQWIEGDTLTSAMKRWTSSLKEDANYQKRLATLQREPGMVEAMNTMAPIVLKYQSRVMNSTVSSVQAAITAGRAKANSIATKQGMDPIFPVESTQ